MSNNNKNIIELFNEEKSIQQLKSLKNQLKNYEIPDNDINSSSNSEQLYTNEQTILSIIVNIMPEKINYFINRKNNSFNYDTFIYVLFGLIKQRLSTIIQYSKNIENNLFHIINKNTIKKIQKIVINFLISFYDFYENNPSYNNLDDVINSILNKNIILEDSFLICCIRIVLILNNNINKEQLKQFFNDSIEEYSSLIKEVISLLIKLLNILIIIKKNKELFKIEDNTVTDKEILKNNKGYYNYNHFEIFVNKIYNKNEPYLMKVLYEFIFDNKINYFFHFFLENDDNPKILLISLTIEKNIRYGLMKILNKSLFISDNNNHLEILKNIKNNNAIAIIFNYISEDLKNKLYNDISPLLQEFKTLFIFSLLIHLQKIDTKKIIIQLLTSNIDLINNDQSNADFNSFINDLYDMSNNMPKYKYTIFEFILLIFESIKNVRTIISRIFFKGLNGNHEEYKIMTKKLNFNLFLDNLSSSEAEVINIYFNFLCSLDKNEYLPLTEITRILDQLHSFTSVNTTTSFIKYLTKFTDIDYLTNNKDFDIYIIEKDNEETNPGDNNLSNNNNGIIQSFIKLVYQSYINNLYNIISDIKDNINSLQSKSPFDSDINISSNNNTNYSNIEEENNNKKIVSNEILNIILDYLPVVLNDKQMFKYFISKKFLDFFSFLVKDNSYKNIAYKLLKIYFKSPNHSEENNEKNQLQILIILSRFYKFFPKDNKESENKEKNFDEIQKLKEFLLMQDIFKIYFKKNLIKNNSEIDKKIENLNGKIINIYTYYSKYIIVNSKEIYLIYNDEYHLLIKEYINNIIKLICISNHNIITKNNICSPINLKKKFKSIIDNLIKFYSIFPEDNRNKNLYFLDIIKYFIDKSINLEFSKDKNEKNIQIQKEESLSEEDFTSFYIDKYKIDKDLLKDNDDKKNKSIISNFCIQSPLLILSLLKGLFKYNKYLGQYLNLILFLCKINQQNILFLLRQNLLKILFNILKEVPNFHIQIFQIFLLCFKYLSKENICLVFENLIKLLNNDSPSNNNKSFIKEILLYITNSIRILSITSNDYFKGIILSKYKIRQPNTYNMLEINNLNFYEENDLDKKNKSIILVKQEIYFYKSLKTKKLLLLRLEKQKENSESEKSSKEKIKNLYLEISFRNLEIIINENDDQIKYDDLSNYNSIFIDNDKKNTEVENYLHVNKNNEIIYIFKEDKKILSIYINGHKATTFKYNFNFERTTKIKVGFPLDLVKDKKMTKFKLYNHIKIKSLRIYLQNSETKEIEKNIYHLSIGKISCDYLFADELTNFKLDENTNLISAYNNLYTARINSIFHKNFIKLQFYRKIFFTDVLIINSLDYIFRLEKYIFILLNYSNIDKIIFNELISLLCTYLIINENFLQKFLAKEEFNSSLYFSLYRNVKFIDKETIENLLSVILFNNNKNSNKVHSQVILNILLDIKLFDSMTPQTKNDLITSINNKINLINKSLLLEKLSSILILCQFNNKNDIDELIINIIFTIFESNAKDEKISNIIEELIYILFYFDKYTSAHLSSYKNGRLKETFKIIYDYFKKVYNIEAIEHINELILKKLESILLDEEYKNKLNKLISSYTSPILIDVDPNKNDLSKNNNNTALNNIFGFEEEEDEEEDTFVFGLPHISNHKIRSKSFSFNKHKRPIINNQNDTNKIFTGRIDIKKNTVNEGQTKLLFNRKKSSNQKKLTDYKRDFEVSDFSENIFQFRQQQSSVRPCEDVILFTSTINKKKRKSFKYLFKRKKEKKRNNIIINLSDEDREECAGECHLCKFIKNILISILKREIKFGIYKNYLLHCLTEVFIMNKDLDFKYSFSYYLMKREGPNRIRKKFNMRIDKLLNSEYDRSAFGRRNIKKDNNSNNLEKAIKNNNIIRSKSIEINNEELINGNEIEKLFMFYENKNCYISENLLNFYNLGQIYNIDIVTNIVDFDDKFQYAFNCLLFKGFSYINGVLVLGKNKIYLLSTVNISSSNILYDAHFPITKRFWIVKKYHDILQGQCKYLSSFDDYQSGNDLSSEKMNNNQNKKKLFEKTLKGFWLYSFYYVEINEIHKKKFLHQNNAIEIFLKNGKNYYLAVNLDVRDKLVKHIISNIKYSHQSKNASFWINNKRDSIKPGEDNILDKDNLNKIEKHEETHDSINNMIYEIQNESLMKSDNMIFMLDNNIFLEKSKKNKANNYYKIFFQNKKKFTLATITDINEIIDKSYDKWTNGYLNTYSYIMILNTVSGRTYNDIAQYPIYPWLISNYSTNELDLTDSKSFRDFMYPIYAQDEETRENLKGKYETFGEDQNEFKYHSGSHYSNAGFVCYYLIRIKPFSQLAAEVQGEFFDTPDRLFFNIEAFFKVSEKYQELIPDVFNLPEIYINSNNFYFELNSDKKNINNVLLPPWASYSPRLFCKILRKSLESQFVSMNINNWIDLIFGYKQKGSEGEKCCNILRNVCSNFNPKKDCEDENEIEQRINELCELGINPKQIFNKSHHKRERHQKMKAFFGRNIFMQFFKAKEEKYLLKNLENNCFIKEMNKYYEYSSEFLSKGEGGLSSFKMCYEEDNDNNNTFDGKESNNNLIYFVITGKKVLLPPSYKNYIQWSNNNKFYIIKPFIKKKYEFVIHHMKKHSINYIKITKDGSFIIIGYNNGVIEKYKLIRMWCPKIKENSKDLSDNKDFNKSSHSSLNSINKKFERAISNDENALNQKLEKENYYIEKLGIKKEKSIHVKGGLFNALFRAKKRKNSENVQNHKKNNEIKKNENDDEEENRQIIESLEKNIREKKINKTSFSNDILFDTHIPISSSNIINSDCIILNNNMGKFIQYNGFPSGFEDFSKKGQNENDNNKNENSQINIPGYDIYSNNKKYLANIANKENHYNSLFKNYIIFLINSSSRILSEISLIEICESYSLMLVIDKLNNLYIYDFNSFDLIKYINCSLYFKNKIKFISICQYTGDFILASNFNIVLMSINGVFITKINNFKSKINHCFISSIYQTNSDLYLFTAHEDGNLLMSKLINNFNGSNFESPEEQDRISLLNNDKIKSLHDKYDPIRIQNISDVYHIAYDTKCCNTDKYKFYKYFENSNNFSLVFDTPIKIKCSQHPIKYIKLTEDKSSLICINSKNCVIYFDYQDFFKNKKKSKDKKNMVYCEKCQNIISYFKTLCQICGKKLCSNCKIEKIIPECSLKNPKPICDECFQIITKNEQNLFTF